jgi:hypothetical protein
VPLVIHHLEYLLSNLSGKTMRAFWIAEMPDDLFGLDGVLALSANRYVEAFVSSKIPVGNSLRCLVR